METNVGKQDKILRMFLGIVALYLGYVGSWIWYVVAVILFFTAYTGFCALYKLLKINTAK